MTRPLIALKISLAAVSIICFIVEGGLCEPKNNKWKSYDVNESNGNRVDGKVRYSSVPKFAKSMVSDVFKTYGSNVRLNCIVKDDPKPNITWYLDGITPVRRMVGEVKHTRWGIELDFLNEVDSGNYTCVVCNDKGCIQFTYKVDVVLEKNTFVPYLKTGEPANITASVNANVLLRCTPENAESDPIGLVDVNRRWFYHNASVGKVTKQNLRHGILKQNETYSNWSPRALKLFKIKQSDEGWYTCTDNNEETITFSSAYLKVVN